MFSSDVCLCVCAQRTLNANRPSSKTVEATDFKYDAHVSRDSLDMTPFSKRAWPGSCDP